MHVLIAGNCRLPAVNYGGTERVMWWLGKALVGLGHTVTYLAAPGSVCPFAKVIPFDPGRTLAEQLPGGIDVVHANAPVREALPVPYLATIHANIRHAEPLDLNSVFISRNHAARFGAETHVHHGIDFDDYGAPDLGRVRRYVHFLGKTAWKRKNLAGAIRVARLANQPLSVLGGYRLNFRMGFRLTLDPRVKFHGMVGGGDKNALLNGSRGLVFPVRWNEPFGLAVVESLYFGCPVYATRYGSLPELVIPEVGFLAGSATELAWGLREHVPSASRCHEYVRDQFSALHMARAYVVLYERILAGEPLNSRAPRSPVEPKLLPFAA